MAAHTLRPFSSANCSICSTVVLPMPRAGVLMMRSRLIESCGAPATFRYAQRVLDLRALIEAEAADDDVLSAVAPQRFFDLPRLEVRAVEHRDAVLRILAESASRSCRR